MNSGEFVAPVADYVKIPFLHNHPGKNSGMVCRGSQRAPEQNG